MTPLWEKLTKRSVNGNKRREKTFFFALLCVLKITQYDMKISGFWEYRASFIGSFYPLIYNLANGKFHSVMVALGNYLIGK